MNKKQKKHKCKVEICDRHEGVVKLKPRSTEQRLQWKEIIDYTGTAVSDFQICEAHFSPAQFDRDLQAELLNRPINKAKFLKRSAIPDINLTIGKISSFVYTNPLLCILSSTDPSPSIQIMSAHDRTSHQPLNQINSDYLLVLLIALLISTCKNSNKQ